LGLIADKMGLKIEKKHYEKNLKTTYSFGGDIYG